MLSGNTLSHHAKRNVIIKVYFPLLLFLLLFTTGQIVAADLTAENYQFKSDAHKPAKNSIINITRQEPLLLKDVNRLADTEILQFYCYDLNKALLFLGQKQEGISNLLFYPYPEKMNIKKALSFYYYKEKGLHEAQCEQNLYFSNDGIYSDRTVLWYKSDKGEWKKLTSFLSQKGNPTQPGRLEIETIPSGAFVYIDGVKKGQTPYSFIMDAPMVEVELKRNGYYTHSFSARVATGKVKKEGFRLVKVVQPQADPKARNLLDTTIENIEEAERHLHKVRALYKDLLKSQTPVLHNFENRYPKLKERDEFEEVAAFRKRAEKYNKTKESERAKLIVDSTAFKTLFKAMEQHIQYLDSKRYTVYLPMSGMRLGRYDIHRHRFPITIKVHQGEFEFEFTGFLPMPTEVAKKYKFSQSEKGIRVQYGKRVAYILSGENKEKRYYKYEALRVPFNGTEYLLTGNLALPKAVKGLKQVKSYLTKKVKQQRVIEKEYSRLQSGTTTYGMKKIPGGTFQMGSNNGDADEKPVHSITVSGFWMDSTEVTQAEYKRLMGVNPSNFSGSTKPVEQCNWYDAVLYCNARSKEAGLDTVYSYSSVTGSRGDDCELSNVRINYSAKGYRLPTEAEWEYACKAGTTTKYYWGDSPSGSYANGDVEYGWPNDGVGNETAVVARYKPNSFGLYDMSGNVWEWCNDWYGENYYGSSPSRNPQGASGGSGRVSRGGSWYYKPANLRSASRGRITPGIQSYDLGFRVLLPL